MHDRGIEGHLEFLSYFHAQKRKYLEPDSDI